MNHFTFESKQKTVLFGFMGLGILCLLLTFFLDSQPLHVRFWTNFLQNTVFFTGIAFITLFIYAAFITSWAGWYTQFKRVMEAMTMFLVPGLVLLLVVIAGLWLGWHELYHWASAEEVAKDQVLLGKSGFLNKGWYTLGTLVIVGIWIFFAMRLRSLSLAEDQNGGVDFAHHRKMRIFAAAFLPVAGFSSAAIIWQWTMSIDAHWYSTLYAWYTGASWFIAANATLILLLIYLKSKGYYQGVNEEHLQDLGKYLFAISIFWTYLWFSQYMLIWYANIGEETTYFQTRMHDYPVLFYGNLVMNFILPFFILMRNDTKRKYGTLVFVCVLVILGHWVDFFQMIKPGALDTAIHAAGAHGGETISGAGGHGDHGAFHMGFTIPGLLDLGAMLGFAALFIFVVFSRLEKVALEPTNDPYMAESVHHHV
ncbi:MAG: hypothetical protein IPJ40_20505 [Saprospirales bacterium]|nr:hypothetical protein [Saprospirales bacterium]